MITDISQLDLNKKYSYADYLTWRFDEMVELIKGKLFFAAPLTLKRHQLIAGNLLREISNHFYKRSCNVYPGPFDVRLLTDKKSDAETFTVVQPDICVIRDNSKIDEKGCVGAPDLIIEIISPYTAKKDINDKYNLYEENGVQEYWIVFPDSNAINQYVLEDDKYIMQDVFVKGQHFSSGIFPDLKIDLEDIF